MEAQRGTLPAPPPNRIHRPIHPENAERTMADTHVNPRGPGLRPWIVGILLLAVLAALGMWLLEERGDDRTLDGVSTEAA